MSKFIPLLAAACCFVSSIATAEQKDERPSRGKHTEAEASSMVRRLATVAFPIQRDALYKRLQIDGKKLSIHGTSTELKGNGGLRNERYWVSPTVAIHLLIRWTENDVQEDRVSGARLVDHSSQFEFEASPLVDKIVQLGRPLTADERLLLSRLHSLISTIEIWSTDHDGHAPHSLHELVEARLQTEDALLHPTQDPNADNKPTAYVYLGRGLRVTSIKQPSKYVIAYERTRFARNGEICLAFLDGHIAIVKIDVAEKIIRHQNDTDLEK